MRAWLVTLALMVLLEVAAGDHIRQYGLMMDAGSSGTRIYIYSWLHREHDSVPNVTPLNQTVWNFRVTPGLSTFYNNLDGIAAYLAPLIDFAKTTLIEEDHADVVLYLKATGGLRARTQVEQENIMAKTTEYLATTGFKFNATAHWASVIAIEEEAYFGWLAVNYLTNHLGDAHTTVGALDMGGATTEISFVPTSAPLARGKTVTLAGVTYDIYTGGYDARGLDTSLLLTIAAAVALANEQEETLAVHFPCYLVGYNQSYTSDGKTYEIIGSGNPSDCADLVKHALLNTSVPCETPPCAFNGVYQPPLTDVKYYAYSGYFYTYNLFFPNGEEVTLAQFADASVGFCEMDYQEAVAFYPPSQTSFLRGYCFTSVYISNLLSVYGFSPQHSVVFAGVINNIEVSWAVGAMLHEAALLPYYPNPVDTTTTATATTDAATTTGAATTAAATTGAATTAAATTGAATTAAATTGAATTAAATTATGATTTGAATTGSKPISGTSTTSGSTSIAPHITVALLAVVACFF